MNQVEACLQNLKPFIEEYDDRGASLEVADRASSLAEFLAVCASSLAREPGPGRDRYSPELIRARDVFVQAGLEALAAREWQAGPAWVQIGVRPVEDAGRRGEFCRRVAEVARRLLSDSLADEFFFMNKPPGTRLRFQATAAGPARNLAAALDAEVRRWRAEGLIDHFVPGVYEPEGQFFGGPQSMDFVHALFTVDSLIWLDYHSVPATEGEAISPAWLVSLAVLRTLFVGLDITGWEDIGVWDRIRTRTGRQLGRDPDSLPTYPEVARDIRDVWSRRESIVDRLHPAVQAIVAHYDSALLTAANRWRSGYFSQRAASVGPRAAAAFYVIFHWNRAGLSATEQALLAESLAERML